LIRSIGDNASSRWLVYSLVAENKNVQDLCLDYATDVRFFLEKATGRLLVTTEARGMIAAENEAASIGRQIAPFWARHRNLFLSGDVSRVLTGIVESLDAVALREGGGSYFVPISRQAALDKLRAFVANLPVSGRQAAQVFAFPILDAGATRTQIRDAANADFFAEIDAAEKDLDRFVEQHHEKAGSVRASTVTARIEAYMRLREKARIYADATGMRQERILDELTSLETKARSLLIAADGGRAERAESDIDLSRLGDLGDTDRNERMA
jgi:hypothetical protein